MTPVSMRELLEAGVHFGHQTNRWDPRMKPYIFGARNGVYIIDLQKTVPLFEKALKFLADLTSKGERVLFVGTKRQAQTIIQSLRLSPTSSSSTTAGSVASSQTSVPSVRASTA